jgi:hypothetical protein
MAPQSHLQIRDVEKMSINVTDFKAETSLSLAAFHFYVALLVLINNY